MKKLLLLLLVLFVLFIGYILFNTFTFPSKQISAELSEVIEIPDSAKFRMSRAIAIPTVSHGDPSKFDSAAFYQFRDFIKSAYPFVDSLLEVTYINEFSLIYKWQGSDSDLKPMIVMGHHDVVPVADENRNKWHADPFGGEIKDGEIWGRGAIDDKISVIGNLEAAELLLLNNFQPKRTIYLCFGHDEELGGVAGAVAIVEHLKKEGLEAEFVIDEGMAITQNMVPGISTDVALIGTAEKGFITLELFVEMEGGHSSMPKEETAIDVLSRAVVKLKDNPFPPELTLPLKDFMENAGPEMPFMSKMVFANPGIFKSMIFGTYEKSPAGNALIRTTTAPTIINAGMKDNVIPYQAKATVNFRTLPGTTIEDVKNYVKDIIDDERIVINEGEFSSEAPQASGTNTHGYRTIEKTIKMIFPNTITSPNMVIGATDSRHYYPLCKDIYRFTPFYLNDETLKTFHGINERISVKDFENAIRFYAQLMKNGSE